MTTAFTLTIKDLKKRRKAVLIALSDNGRNVLEFVNISTSIKSIVYRVDQK